MLKYSLLAIVLAFTACTSSPTPELAREALARDVQTAIDNALYRSPQLKRLFDESYGYAVFPKAGKGAFIVGAGHGTGQVFQKGKGRAVGEATISQVSIGLQVGGQSFSEFVFFRDKFNFENFTNGKFSFAANASAVALESGASTNIDYKDGVAAFTMTQAGLMVEASIAGQSFSFSWYLP
jgi:lipid-binding SYLF domain-containing protein